MSALVVQQQTQTAPVVSSGLQIGDRGCDVASYQRMIDWQAYAASGRTFVFIKATEGTNYVNPYFAPGWMGSKAAGVIRGAYHFARPSQNTPEAEVAWFLKNVRPLNEDDMLALDLEVGTGDLYGWTLRFLNGIAKKTGRRAYLYSGLWFMQPHNLLRPQIEQASAGLWYAAYQGSVPPPPPGWSHITFWQHTSSASVPGIAGDVDESIYLG